MKCWRCWVLGLMAVIATAVISMSALFHIYNSTKPFPDWVNKSILFLAQFPYDVKRSLREISSQAIFSEFTAGMLRGDNFEDHRFPCENDSGYLLLAALNPNIKRVDIRLIRMSDGKILHQWLPKFEKVYEGKNQSSQKEGYRKSYEINHPFLMKDGSIIARSGEYLFKMDINSEIEWSVHGDFHHSIDVEGSNIWVLSHDEDYIKDEFKLSKNIILDDALERINTDGKSVEKISFSKVLINNNLHGLLFSQHGAMLQEDVLHLNSIVVARIKSKFWNKGDLLITSRHLNTVFLYRPSTKKIIWYKTGPWLNPHDAEFINSHQISIFGNDVISPKNNKVLFIDETNHAYIYDFEVNKVKTKFDAILRRLNVRSITEGRLRVLSDGSVYIEETNRNRHLRIGKNSDYCIRYNKFDEKNSGAVFWSKYLERSELPKIFY